MLYTGRLTVKNNIYQAVINYKENGKYKTKWISTGLVEKGNKRRAEQFLKKAIDEFETTINQKSKNQALSDLIDEWLEMKKPSIRGNTITNYIDVSKNHIKPHFDNLGLPIQKLEVRHFQNYFTEKSKYLSPSSLDKHYTVISCALEYAVNTLEILAENKVKRVELPKKEKRIPNFYTESQLKKLFKLVEGESIETPVILSGTYGLRRSEVLGLTWKSVNFKRNTLTIGHTAVRNGSDIIYDDIVKAESSFRTLPLTETIKIYLLKIKSKQEHYKELLGNTYHESDYICTWEDGRPLSPDYVTSRFRRFLKTTELPIIRFHDLRHSSASLLVNMGFTLQEVMEWLGHADIASTSIYSHLLYKSKENMAKKVNEVLSL